MRNSRASVSMPLGFTLVELLVVIIFIGLLAIFFLSGPPHVREPARRAVCKANVQGIAWACGAYMNDPAMFRKSSYRNAMPNVAPAPSQSNWGSTEAGNPSALWLLVTYEFVGRDSFLCPSAEVSMDFHTPDADDTQFSADTLSYRYLSQVAFTDANTNTEIKATGSLSDGLKDSELAIIADANPRCRPGGEAFDNDFRGKNSLNHNQAGQNVAFLDGHADWFSTTTIPGTKPLAGSNAPDDIYQSCGSNAEDATGRRGALNDAFLIP